MGSTLAQVVKALERVAPARHRPNKPARHGLVLGRPDAPVARVLLAVDATPAVVEEASARHASLLVVMTDPFAERTSLVAREPQGALAFACVRAELAVIVVGQAWAATRSGACELMLDKLEAGKARPLVPLARESFVSVAVLVDEAHLEPVIAAMHAAGGGTLEPARREHAFTHRGHTRVTPYETLDDGVTANARQPEQHDQVRVLVRVPEEAVKNVVTAASQAHPSAAPPIELIRLANTERAVGAGRVGELPVRRPLSALIGDVMSMLGVEHLRVAGERGEKIKRLAVTPHLTPQALVGAANYGAGLVVAGDVSHVLAREAMARGLSLIDPGAHALWRFSLPVLRDRIALLCDGLDVQLAGRDRDPFLTHARGAAR